MTKLMDMTELISGFIVSTCQLLPKVSVDVYERVQSQAPGFSYKPGMYSVRCGSTVEFYTLPMHSCINDIDELTCNSGELAFLEDIPVLPSDARGLQDTIDCYKIEPCLTHPSFVRLQNLGHMSYNWKRKEYKFHRETSRSSYIAINLDVEANKYKNFYKQALVQNNVNGPALSLQWEDRRMKVDYVTSVWCPQWPREAQDWRDRPRSSGWPTTATISEVVKNGCHVVYVQHRACRDDIRQWRFSFSVAEVILLQSWTQVQQIVYHMLRFFAKRELIEKDCPKEDEVLCNYHFKTLMLWTCEEKSTEWWNLPSVVVVCFKMLRKLSKWLKKRHCPNYFIPKANLFFEHMNPTMIARVEKRLNGFFNSDILCSWFEENYILPITLEFVSIGNSANEVPHFLGCMLYLFDWQKRNQAYFFDQLVSLRFQISNVDVGSNVHQGLDLGLGYAVDNIFYDIKLGSIEVHELKNLPLTENIYSLKYYLAKLYTLHSTYGISCGKFLWDNMPFVEFVIRRSLQTKIVRSQYHNFPKPYSAERSQFCFVTAQSLMENLTGSNSGSEFQLLSIMSKEFLRKALKCEDSNSESIASAALVYLAAVHFATSEYQTTMDLCSQVFRTQSSKEENETLNARCLFFIDDVVRIIGFWLLYRKIKNEEHFTIRPCYFDLRLTSEVFAHYLTVSGAEKISNDSHLDHELPTLAFPVDEYLMVLTKRKFSILMKARISLNISRQCAYRRTKSLTKTENFCMNPFQTKEKIINLLLECALENMTLFYSAIHKDFGIQCNTVDCYRALYLYKRRQYTEVLYLCEQILHEPELQGDLKKLSFTNILLLPPLDSYFDEDVQSLLGFHTLLCYLSPANDEMSKWELTRLSTFEHCFAYLVYNKKYTLSTFLRGPYFMRRYYFLGRHFLARFLKFRCFIDCNHPYTEIKAAFDAMKTNLLFERIIYGFLRQKLREIQK